MTQEDVELAVEEAVKLNRGELRVGFYHGFAHEDAYASLSREETPHPKAGRRSRDPRRSRMRRGCGGSDRSRTLPRAKYVAPSVTATPRRRGTCANEPQPRVVSTCGACCGSGPHMCTRCAELSAVVLGPRCGHRDLKRLHRRRNSGECGASCHTEGASVSCRLCFAVAHTCALALGWAFTGRGADERSGVRPEYKSFYCAEHANDERAVAQGARTAETLMVALHSPTTTIRMTTTTTTRRRRHARRRQRRRGWRESGEWHRRRGGLRSLQKW